ncbi:MAG: hypothetical protein BWY91_02339 [bacterium ADurb.BinA028]|nr:MAG: hypothetical protein BWY91_02339 [bacterium ADurb.BinA028]
MMCHQMMAEYLNPAEGWAYFSGLAYSLALSAGM